MPHEERRELLVTVAIKVFASSGLRAANHTTVAKAAGISVPAVFFYFPTREDLVDAVLARIDDFFSGLLCIDDPRAPADQVMLERIRALTASTIAERELTAVYREWSISSEPGLWHQHLKLLRKFTRTWARLIRRGQKQGIFRSDLDPEDEAMITHASSTAIFQLQQMGAGPEQIDKFILSIVNVLAKEAPPASRLGKSARA